MGLSKKRVANPFPRSSWANEAYRQAAYMSITMGYEFDGETGEIATKPRPFISKEPVKGSPGEVFTNPGVIASIGQVATEAKRIDLAFMLGYCQAELERMKRGDDG